MNKKLIGIFIVSLFFLTTIPISTHVSAYAPTEGSFSKTGQYLWSGSYFISGDNYIGPYLKNLKYNDRYVFDYINIPYLYVGTPACYLRTVQPDDNYPTYDAHWDGSDYHQIVVYHYSQHLSCSQATEVDVTFDMTSAKELKITTRSFSSSAYYRYHGLWMDPSVSPDTTKDTSNFFMISNGENSNPYGYTQAIYESYYYADRSEGSSYSDVSIWSEMPFTTPDYGYIQWDLTHYGTSGTNANNDGVYTLFYVNKCNSDCDATQSGTIYSTSPGDWSNQEEISNTNIHIVSFILNTGTTTDWSSYHDMVFTYYN